MMRDQLSRTGSRVDRQERRPRISTIPGTKTVLLAGELDGRAYASIRQAHTWATTLGARLVVCALLPRRDQLPFRAGLGVQHLRTQLMLQASAVGERVAQVTGRALDAFDVQVASGPWHKAIPETAAAIGAELVVMSARREEGFLSSFGLGTVEQVLQRASCPVLLAHPSPSNGAVLAATDLSDPSLPVVHRAAEYARARSGALTVLHWTHPRSRLSGALRRPAQAHVTRQLAQQALERALASAEIQAWPKVVDEAAATNILTEAQRIVAELVVLGSATSAGLIRPLTAMVAADVARRAPCSVLVVPLRCGKGGPRA